MVENGAAVARHVQIVVAVIVEIADSDSLAIVSFASDTGLVGHVSKCAVPVVVVQRTAQRMRRLVNIRRGGLYEVQIHQPVLVIIDPGDAGAHGLQVVLFLSLRGVLLKGNLRSLANVGIADGNSGSVLRLRHLRSHEWSLNSCAAGEQEREGRCGAEHNWG